MSSQSPERAIQIERFKQAYDLATTAMDQMETEGQASLSVFDTEDSPVNYLAAMLFSADGLKAALESKDPIVIFPELEGPEHIEGYLGAMAIVSGARHVMVEGILDDVPVLATPGASDSVLYDRYLTSMTQLYFSREQ